MVRIGDRVRDRINGFSGVATGRTEYLNGCRQFLVKPDKLKEDGGTIDGLWIDEQNLLVTEPQVFADPFAPSSVVPAVGGPDRRERST